MWPRAGLSATVLVCVWKAEFRNVAVYFVLPAPSQVAASTITDVVLAVSVCLWLVSLEQIRVAVTLLLSEVQL